MDLSVKQVSFALNIPAHRIYRLLRNGKIPHKRVSRGKRRIIRFEREALHRWLSDSKGQIGGIKIPKEALDRLARMESAMSPLEMERIVTEIRKIKHEIEKIPKIRRRTE